MNDLASEVRSLRIKPEQVQDFTPTPMTLSTLMYYTDFDPYSGKKVYVAKRPEEKKRQKEYFFWYKKEFKSNNLRQSARSAGRNKRISR
jgi:radical SAM superfamily enzyme YgiQ (UPF0313 family)